MGVQSGEVAARASGQPATERRELERLREEPQRQAVRPQLVLQPRPEHAGLDPGRPTGAVDLEDAVEPAEVEADDAGVVPVQARLDSADDRTAAPVRDDRDLRPRTPVEHVDHVPLVDRPHHQIGDVAQIAGQVADDVAEGLAAAVRRAVGRPGRADARQRRRRREAYRRQVERRHIRRLVRGGNRPGHRRRHPSDQGLALRRTDGVLHAAPAPPRPGPAHVSPPLARPGLSSDTTSGTWASLTDATGAGLDTGTSPNRQAATGRGALTTSHGADRL